MFGWQKGMPGVTVYETERGEMERGKIEAGGSRRDG
jgi:hypothetical protein